MKFVCRATFVVRIFILIFSKTNSLRLSHPISWSRELDLETESGVKFRWTNSKPDRDGQRWITMEVSAKATGYVGAGFSPNGGMRDGDMAIAWMGEDGNPILKDFYGIENGAPIEDCSQDYTLLHFETNQTWTTMRFKRRWDTCDPHDFQITNDTMRLIWAYSNHIPIITNGNFRARYHGPTSRGVKSVNIEEGSSLPIFPDAAPEMFPGVKSFDMKVNNVSITLKDTYYFCKLLKFTELHKKHHLIGWKPIIQKGNKDLVHHITLFECSVPQDDIPLFDNFHSSHDGGQCYTPNMPPKWGQNCIVVSLVWVVGSEGEMFPQHVGSPLGEMHGGATYFMLEMHYENAGHRITTDSSGIRFFYTDKLRKHDGGTMLVGYHHSPFLLIPPNQNDFVAHGLCGKECTSAVIPPIGINITSAVLHMHLTGKKMGFRHVRNGIELPVIAEDKYYDFNFQIPRTLKQEITILPGDELLVDCEYTTKNVNRYVIGGIATSEEMCQVFFFYYPRIPLAQCTSHPEFHDFFKGFHIDKVEGERVLKALNMPYEPTEERKDDFGDVETLEGGISFSSVFNHLNITRPQSLVGKTVGQYLEEIKWSDEKGKTLERVWKEGKHYQFCSQPGLKRIMLKNHIINYPEIKKGNKSGPSSVCLMKNYILRSAGSNLVAPTALITIIVPLMSLKITFIH